MDCVDTDALGAGRVPENEAPVVEVDVTVAMTAGARVIRLPPRFHVIDGGRTDEDSGDTAAKPKMWLCKTCEEDIGVATSVVEPVWQGPLREQGRVRLSSGTKRVVCTHCKMRGKLTFAD